MWVKGIIVMCYWYSYLYINMKTSQKQIKTIYLDLVHLCIITICLFCHSVAEVCWSYQDYANHRMLSMLCHGAHFLSWCGIGLELPVIHVYMGVSATLMSSGFRLALKLVCVESAYLFKAAQSYFSSSSLAPQYSWIDCFDECADDKTILWPR